MRAGDLRRRVTIQTRSSTKDGYGQQQTTWVDYLTGVPAEIVALTGRELMAAQGMNSEVTHEITVRYHASLASPVQTAAMRILYGSRIFDIRASMNTDERNQEIRLLASEGLTQG